MFHILSLTQKKATLKRLIERKTIKDDRFLEEDWNLLESFQVITNRGLSSWCA
jgi:hypothetical protein